MHRVNVSLYAAVLTVLISHISRGKTRLLQNTPLRSHAWWGQNSQQDAQKGQTSHPPNPGGYFTRPPRVFQDSLFAQGRAFPQAKPQLLADPRFTFHASRFTVPGSDARTKLADFFSILLDVEELVDHLVGGERVEHGHDPPCEFEV